MKTPDITPAQIVAVVASLLAMLTAFGLPITSEQSDAIVQFVTVSVPVLILSDALIRFGRARNADKIASVKRERTRKRLRGRRPNADG